MPTVTIQFRLKDGQPEWQVEPPSLNIPYNPNARINITWKLQNSPGAAFASENGVAFDKGGPAWPGSAPVASGADYSAEEVNNNGGSTPIKYDYTITVTLNGKTYKHDPDITNDPPPPPGHSEFGHAQKDAHTPGSKPDKNP